MNHSVPLHLLALCLVNVKDESYFKEAYWTTINA